MIAPGWDVNSTTGIDCKSALLFDRLVGELQHGAIEELSAVEIHQGLMTECFTRGNELLVIKRAVSQVFGGSSRSKQFPSRIMDATTAASSPQRCCAQA